jgi:thymidylate kinase
MLKALLTENCRPFRIAVSGAHGVGKTTFCSDLKAALLRGEGQSISVELVTQVARSLNAQGIAINRGTEEDQYALFFAKHISNLFRTTKSSVMIYDRTIIDSIAYATANGNLAKSWMQFAKVVAQNVIDRIDVYFYIPIEFSLEDDGIRPSDVAYQAQLDDAVLQLLREFRSDFAVVAGSRDERVAGAARRLNLPFKIGSSGPL